MEWLGKSPVRNEEWDRLLKYIEEVTGFNWIRRWFWNVAMKLPPEKATCFDIEFALVLRMYIEELTMGSLWRISFWIRHPGNKRPAPTVGSWIMHPNKYYLPTKNIDLVESFEEYKRMLRTRTFENLISYVTGIDEEGFIRRLSEIIESAKISKKIIEYLKKILTANSVEEIEQNIVQFAKEYNVREIYEIYNNLTQSLRKTLETVIPYGLAIRRELIYRSYLEMLTFMLTKFTCLVPLERSILDYIILLSLLRAHIAVAYEIAKSLNELHKYLAENLKLDVARINEINPDLLSRILEPLHNSLSKEIEKLINRIDMESESNLRKLVEIMEKSTKTSKTS